MNRRSDSAFPRRSGKITAESVSELDSHLSYWLRLVSNHVSQRFRKKVESRGVTLSEWVIIREMYRLGPTSASELCPVLGMTKGAVSKLIARLENKNLLTRFLNDLDQRNHVIELTPVGRALVPILAKLADRNDMEVFGHMPEKVRDDFMKAMKEIVRNHRMKAGPCN